MLIYPGYFLVDQFVCDFVSRRPVIKNHRPRPCIQLCACEVLSLSMYSRACKFGLHRNLGIGLSYCARHPPEIVLRRCSRHLFAAGQERPVDLVD